MNPRLLAGLFSVPIRHYDDQPWWRNWRAPVLFCTGSILERDKRSQRQLGVQIHVWGTGTRGQKPLSHLARAKIHAVRGPLTRQRLLDAGIACPEIYGDPALLLPRVLPSARPGAPNGPISVIPHYVDRERCRHLMAGLPEDQWRLIDVADDLDSIVEAITTSRCVLSSSLHGLIVSDTYSIPNARIRFGGAISGGNFKFHDYFLSVGRPTEEVMDISGFDDLREAVSLCRQVSVALGDQLVAAFPDELL